MGGIWGLRSLTEGEEIIHLSIDPNFSRLLGVSSLTVEGLHSYRPGIPASRSTPLRVLLRAPTPLLKMIKSHLSVGQGRRILEWNCRAFCHVPQSLAPQHCAPLGRVSPKQISKSIYPPGTNANRCMKRPCGAHSLTLRSVPISFSVGCLLEAGLAKAAGKHFVGTRWPASLLTAITAAISVFQEVHCYPHCTIARIATTLLYADFTVRAQMKYWWLGCLCRFLLTTFLRHIRNSTVVMLSLQFILPCALRTRATSLPGLPPPALRPHPGLHFNLRATTVGKLTTQLLPRLKSTSDHQYSTEYVLGPAAVPLTLNMEYGVEWLPS